MMSFGKVLTIATLAVGVGVVTAPIASACGNFITQPAVIDTSLAAPVLNTTLVQPAIIGASGCSTCADTTMITQPAVIDTGCATTLVQPAVLAPSCGVPACGYGFGYGFGFPRRHLLDFRLF